MILESVENGPLLWPTVEENRVTRPKKYFELSVMKAIQADCDVKETNIILQGLPLEVNALVRTHKVSKELWERIQMLMQGTSLTKQERGCKLYDEFDKFAYKKRESLCDFYLRFLLLLNDMNIYNMKLEQFQVNTKFLNTLPPEWSKFVTDVKLVRDLHTTNVDQLHAYLGQHEYHANEYASQAQSSTPLSITYPLNDFQSSVNHNVYNPSSSIPQVEYAPSVHQQSDFFQPDTGLVVSLRNSSNPRQQATINNGRVTIQPIQGRQNSLTTGMSRQYTSGPSGTNSGKQRVIVCYNCKGEGHMSKQCTKPKRKRDEAWFKDKYVNESQYATVQNSSFLAQQDDRILSVIEQLKTQVVNCTKINQDNKNVNEILTAELERYKDQNSGNSEEPNISTSSTIAEVLKELPKVSMVNLSLKKLKFHLASFDMVVKERTTATTITEGTWGFEHTKACFRDEIIPFVKALKELFNSFDQFLIDELTEVQNVFNQMEHAVEQHCVEKNKHQDKMKDVLKENERLLEQAISTDIVNIVVNANVNYASQSQEKDTIIMKLKKRIKSLSGNVKEEKIKREIEKIETINIELDHRVTKLVAENEHLKQTYKQLYDSIKSSCVRSKEQCDALIKQVNIKSAENSDLNASFQEKVLVIIALKDTLSKLKGKAVVTKAVTLHPIDPELLKIDVAPLAPKLQNNRTAHNDYLKHTQEETATLREIVENERLLNPFNTSLDYVCNTKKDRIQQTQSRAKKNKLEDHPRTVRPSLHNKKSVVNTKAISSVPNSKLNVNSDLKCAMCNGCLFSDNHDSCVLEFINSMNAHVKSKSAKKPLINFAQKFLGTVKFRNDHVAKIMGYGDYKIRNVTILRVYFVEGLGHNLFSVGQFCDSDLEVAFRQHTCFIRNLDGVDLLTGSQGNNLYTLSLRDMMASSPIYLLSKASKTKSWLWHHRLSHLNFDAINHLARQGLVRGKLEPKADIRIFIFYAPTKKAFQIYNRRTRRIVETIHVDFDELTAMAFEQSSSGPALNEMTPVTTKPKMYKDALTQSCWIEAMQEELNEFERVEVWELVPRPDKAMVITLKWIYKVKLDKLGGILKNKAGLVARGYRQEEGIDFEESFAPKYGFESCDPVDTPMVEKSKLDEDKDGKVVDSSHYRGSATEKHIHAVKRILRYLRGTVNQGLWYPKDSSIALSAFADVDHAGCQDTRRSLSGSLQFLRDRLISWSSKRQKSAAIS
nr:integrase, catalytic region, zinc finger, CCHC-type, peptidase aspartic, catalytic [Tanacetum cinerariifolium]